MGIMARPLVSPYWMPLVHGTTRILAEGGRVGLLDCVESMGLGSSRPVTPVAGTADCHHWDQGHHRFSPSFQWLPCEVAFREVDSHAAVGDHSPRVEIQSYINNVHPRWHRQLYEVLEAVIGPAIRSWDEIPMHRGKACGEVHFQGRDPMRIQTFGAQWSPDLPMWASSLDSLDSVKQGTLAYEEALANVYAYLDQPDQLFSDPVLDPVSIIPLPIAAELRIRPHLEYPKLSDTVKRKYARIRRPVHPESGSAYTYEEWKQGKVNAAVVPPRAYAFPNHHILRDHIYYTISLEDMFRDRGLQVVVEIDAVSLLPGDPPRGGTDWQLAGALNDRIVATSVVFFSSENVTPDSGAVSFRVEADMEPLVYRYEADTAWDPHHPLDALKGIFGFDSCRQMGNNDNEDPVNDGKDQEAVQQLGTVTTPDGRLVSFPNAVQHQIGLCRLADASKPGRRRVLKLHLVDPHYRVLSTRNVPAQHAQWCHEAVWDRISWAARGVPPEIEAMIDNELGDWPPRRGDVERTWHDMRQEYRCVCEDTFANIDRYELAPRTSEGYEWPNRFPGEPEPPYHGPGLDAFPDEIM